MGQRVRPLQRKQPGSMNKLEEAYSDILLLRQRAGEIVSYRYEAVKLRLAEKTFYTPDFIVTFPDHIECHEVKGFWEEDARIKIKVAATMFPEFAFIAVQYKKKEWITEEF